MQIQIALCADFPTQNGQPAPQHTQLQLYSSSGASNQMFKFVPTNPYTEDNQYTIVHLQTGYCMDALSYGTNNGDAVGLFPCTGASNQMWSLNPYNGGYLIVGIASNRCVNELSGNKALFDKITLWDCVPDSNAATNMVWGVSANIIPDKKLNKFGNDLLKNVEITLLLWGNVPNAGGYPDFYQTLLSSKTFQMLGQYGIGPGSFKGTLQLPLAGGPPLPPGTDLDIGLYLRQVIQAGLLTPNPNTYYAVHFAPGIGASCKQDCGYHGKHFIGDLPNQNTSHVIYGVLPDLTGCGCNAGTGNIFDSQTMVASHELFEGVTDPTGGGGYFESKTGQEIADLCGGKAFTISGASGKTYYIQRMWSNIAMTCVE
ncbi:hypothetical protein HDU76_013368 [Blyttiomyces sp. JEL0837]|nr:hypothetical protein HDU76_013368 [Blyttiomyces sp. JEL0837]